MAGKMNLKKNYNFKGERKHWLELQQETNRNMMH